MNFNEISVYDTPEKSPGFLLWHISTSWRARLEAVLKPLNLTHPQFVVLATLGWLTKDGKRVSQGEIGKMAALDPNTTSQIVRGLEKKGLLKREPSQDARAKQPLLTAQGQKLLKKALPAVESADSQFFQALSKKELRSLLKHLESLCTITRG